MSGEDRISTRLAQKPLHVRRYAPKDKRAVRRLHDDALNEVGAHLGSGPWDDDLDDIENVYLDSGGEFLVGILDGKIVSYHENGGHGLAVTRLCGLPLCPLLHDHGVCFVKGTFRFAANVGAIDPLA